MSEDGRIPIENIYHLLAYAWDRLPEAGLIDVGALEGPDIQELCANILLEGVKFIARKGLEQVYEPSVDELGSIRGKVDVIASARRLLLWQGRARCEFDELTVNSIPNRVLTTTLQNLARVEEMPADIANRLKTMSRRLQGVTRVRVTSALFRSIQFHRNNGFYRFLMNVCELVHTCLAATEKPGRYRFRDFLQDPQRMPALFERFLLNFYRRELHRCRVRVEEIRWKASSSTDVDLQFLPKMRTDITIRAADKIFVIDAKFYESPFQTYYETQKLRSAHLYQLFAYLNNFDSDLPIAGMLIYPRAKALFNMDYQVGGHPMRIRSLDLTQPWNAVRSDLLSMVDEPSIFDANSLVHTRRARLTS